MSTLPLAQKPLIRVVVLWARSELNHGFGAYQALLHGKAQLRRPGIRQIGRVAAGTSGPANGGPSSPPKSSDRYSLVA